MKTLFPLAAAAAGLMLVSASPPPERGGGGAEAGAGYPPCSATVTDRCIQTNERGVARAARPDRRSGPGGELESVVAAGPPAAAPAKEGSKALAGGSYPPCSATVTDRCVQSERRRYAGAPARRIYRTTRVQLAYRYAGERG